MASSCTGSTTATTRAESDTGPSASAKGLGQPFVVPSDLSSYTAIDYQDDKVVERGRGTVDFGRGDAQFTRDPTVGSETGEWVHVGDMTWVSSPLRCDGSWVGLPIATPSGGAINAGLLSLWSDPVTFLKIVDQLAPAFRSDAQAHRLVATLDSTNAPKASDSAVGALLAASNNGPVTIEIELSPDGVITGGAVSYAFVAPRPYTARYEMSWTPELTGPPITPPSTTIASGRTDPPIRSDGCL